MSKIRIHDSQRIAADQLFVHPNNTNKQSRHTYKELRKSIRENGFDESLIVVPRSKEEGGYWVVSGNHRLKSGIAEGMTEFPCVVRDDWNGLQQEVELARRNLVRGDIDKHAFTDVVNRLAEEKSLSKEELSTLMGFQDLDVFAQYYQEEEQKREQSAIEGSKKASAPQIKMIDDLGLILSAIFEQYGDTVPNSFIIFPAGQKRHMFVAATPALVKSLQEVAQYCVANHLDINIVLGGLLMIGMDQSQMRVGKADGKALTKKGTQKGSSDL